MRLVPVIVCVLWACYSLNGFRGWWVPITLSDGDAGSIIRQILFLGSAGLIAGSLWISGRVWSCVRAHWRFALLALWLVLTTLYSQAPELTLKRAVLFSCGAVATAGMMELVRDPLRFVSRILTYIPAAAAWMSLLWWLVLPSTHTANPARSGLAGISNHPNTLAPALAIGVVMALALRPSSGIERVARALSITGCAVALGMTASVTSIMLGAVGAAVLVALLLPPYWRGVAGLVAAGMTASFFVIGADAISRSLLSSIGRDASFSGRDELWSIVIAKIQEAPVFGRGWGAFWTEGRGRELVSSWNPRQSHNAYLDVVLEVGLAGALVFIVTLGPGLWASFRRWRSHKGAEGRRVCAALMAIATGLFLVYALQQSFIGRVDAFAFYCVLLGTAALASQEKQESPAGYRRTSH